MNKPKLTPGPGRRSNTRAPPPHLPSCTESPLPPRPTNAQHTAVPSPEDLLPFADQEGALVPVYEDQPVTQSSALATYRTLAGMNAFAAEHEYASKQAGFSGSEIPMMQAKKDYSLQEKQNHHKSWNFGSCVVSESKLVNGLVMIENNQAQTLRQEYAFDTAEFVKKSDVVNGDMDGDIYHKTRPPTPKR
ncbi:hypothetical protein ASPZODRAFT_13824 [Penicilliopsis zonata CBS 506.65]|uniref:Uncharacterized protein n=1 Tax=Penicilliopsis zonata CBS 506.65 TaxID=1073090 RepID=A0A1L9SPN9_9EURO|nr:hypothetical protein ASPZODRAFT_13824 [Penicilliopsis zonata CBS 506.65]OJJ49086.1 hypothetical protein ASPZODRAFT_13824 [Penicilliopsis zonata CBS 506.65]